MYIGDTVKTADTIYKIEGVIIGRLENGLIAFKSADGVIHHFFPENLKVIEEVPN